jgi:WD40 repeat protein
MGDPRFREHGHGTGTCAVAYVRNGGEQCVLTAGADGKIKLWGIDGNLLRETDDNDQDSFYSLAVSPDGTFMAAGDENKVLVCFAQAYFYETLRCILQLLGQFIGKGFTQHLHAFSSTPYVCSCTRQTRPWS